MRHTLVIEIPDKADDELAEQRITAAVQRVMWSEPDRERAWIVNTPTVVVEYHHEQMTADPDEHGA